MTAALLYGPGCAWALVAAVCFHRMPRSSALVLVVFGGWCLLPVMDYGALLAAHPAPVGDDAPPSVAAQIMGTALPAGPLWTKAAAVAVSALLGMLLGRPRLLREIRWGRWEWVGLGFCLMPLVSALRNDVSLTSGLTDVAYLATCWLLPWTLGRVCLGTTAHLHRGARALTMLGALLLPPALVEFARGPFLYDALFGAHPYSSIGAGRYVGYRPMLLFEDGNQFGMWLATVALMAAGVWLNDRGGRNARRALGSAIVLFALTLLCQSRGAVLLYFVGLATLGSLRYMPRRALIAACGLLVVGALIVPVVGGGRLRGWVKSTSLGQQSKEVLKSVGAKSLAWRVDEDMAHGPRIRPRLLLGWGTPRWWAIGADARGRPWGLAMLMVGAYGLAGFGLWSLWLLHPLIGAMRGGIDAPSWIVTTATACLWIHWLDGFLNSFFIVPWIAIAAGVSAVHGRRIRAPAA